MDEPKLYKPSEFAKITGTSVKTLQKWDREGRLMAYRTPSGRRYYTEKHVVEFKRSIPEEARIKDLVALHMWLAPYPLKAIQEADVSGIERTGDHVARAVAKNRRASASTWFSLYGMVADRHVTMAPITIGTDTGSYDVVLFRIETPKADRELLASDESLMPDFVETDEDTYWFGKSKNAKISVKTSNILSRLFWAFDAPLAHFIWMEPGTITVCLDNVFREETAMATILEFDKYLTAHPDITAIISEL